ncbi:hypothetical protein [Algoriphagus sp. SE2]|uniref:hypothetical protein n=1 Tax=Algoriphagus sp. SE2 TaxID=3141536 RepID=UPI0031E3876D
MDQYIKWSDPSNEKKAGLPVNSSNSLKAGTYQLYGLATKFQTKIVDLKNFWNTMSTSTNTNELKLFGAELVTRLGDLNQIVQLLIQQSASVQATLRNFDGIVNNHNKTVSKKLADAQTNLANISARVSQFKSDMNRAISTRDRDQAYQNWFMWVTTEQEEQYKLSTIQLMQKELSQCQALLANLDILENSITTYQNMINAASIQITDAHDKEQNALNTTNEKVFTYYQKKVGNHMTNLFGII